MPASKVLIVPMAGYGQRFRDAGYSLPKQFLRLNDTCCLVESLSSMDLSYFDLVVIGCRAEFERSYNVSAFLEDYFPEIEFSVVCFDQDTSGSLDTVLRMVESAEIDGDAEISIFTLDVKFEAKQALAEMTGDADVLVVKTNNPGFSYVQTAEDDAQRVIRTAEKRVISDLGAVGLYRFAKCSQLVEIARAELAGPPNYGAEHYICPMFNRFIEAGYSVTATLAERMLMFGTPDEYEFCKSLRQTHSRRVALASDHSGYNLKQSFKKVALERGYLVDDYGCYSKAACDYDDFVSPATTSVIENKNGFCLSFCASGQGVNISASSTKGIRSVLVYKVEKLKEHLAHNAPNHFSIPSSIIESDKISEIFDILETIEFEGGRHQDRLLKVTRRENG